MDEAVAMLLAAPALALAVWTLAHVGDRSNAAGRAEVAVELAASAAAEAAAHGASDLDATSTARRVASGATLDACDGLDHLDVEVVHSTGDPVAAVTAVCRVPHRIFGPTQLCVTGYAQHRPAALGHVRRPAADCG